MTDPSSDPFIPEDPFLPDPTESRYIDGFSSGDQRDPAIVDDSEPAIHPGQILGASFMLPRGLLPTRLARALRVPVNRITDILTGKRRITAQTALLLAVYFETSPEFWLRLQMEYDLRCARRRGHVRTHLQAIQSARRFR